MLWLYSVGLYKLSFSIATNSYGNYVIYLVWARYVCHAKLRAAIFSESLYIIIKSIENTSGKFYCKILFF